jgi:hypothetical protein
MMNFNNKDKKAIENLYILFLKNLEQFVKTNQINNIFKLFNLYMVMLKLGNFSATKNVVFDAEYKYLYIDNMKNGMQVMDGIYCCRHVNGLLYDFLQLLGYKCTLIKLYCSDDEQIYIAQEEANHIGVLVAVDNDSFLLDATNGSVYELAGTEYLYLKSLDNDINNYKETICNNYYDDNIAGISKILHKYKQLNDLGIKHVYDYN